MLHPRIVYTKPPFQASINPAGSTNARKHCNWPLSRRAAKARTRQAGVDTMSEDQQSAVSGGWISCAWLRKSWRNPSLPILWRGETSSSFFMKMLDVPQNSASKVEGAFYVWARYSLGFYCECELVVRVVCWWASIGWRAKAACIGFCSAVELPARICRFCVLQEYFVCATYCCVFHLLAPVRRFVFVFVLVLVGVKLAVVCVCVCYSH